MSFSQKHLPCPMATDEAGIDCLDVPISHRYQGDDQCSIVQFLAKLQC